jgi:1-acyl-sn-glycerol-3-phosphate acyltransferase
MSGAPLDRLRRAGEHAGLTAPARRLAVTPRPLAVRLPRPVGFPLTVPTRPNSLPHEPAERRLGVDYDTAWARRYPARVARLALVEAVTRPLVRAVADPEVDGLDRIEHLEGPVVFASNHASHLDTPILLSCIPERWRNRLVVAGAADYFFDTRLKAATFALTLGAVPVERRRINRRSADQLTRLLEAGWSVLIFPEGGRSPDGWGQAHRAGAVWPAARAGVPVVPVHLQGSGRILPRGSTRPRPGRTRVTFGRPLRGSEPRELAARTEAAIAALADEATTDWWSARRRAARGATPPLTGPGAAAAWRRAWTLGPASQSGRKRTWPD